MAKEMIAMLLAGGQGSRLYALTQKLAKPAVPFGGKYRIIDFPLSNCINSGVDTVGVLTQYQPLSLNQHIGIGIPWDLDRKNGGVTILAPHVKGGEQGDWYSGTANAIYQNIGYIDANDPEYVIILSGDQICKQDYSDFLEFHKAKNAEFSVAVMEVPWEEAPRFGLMVADENDKITEFQEKPKNPKSNLASMGIYIFNWDILKKYLEEDEADPNSENDFGKNIIPNFLKDGRPMYAYSFEGYWKDVGTLNSLWDANMDLLDPKDPINMRDPSFRIYARNYSAPATRIGTGAKVTNSFVAEGCTIRGSVEHSVLYTGCRIEEGAVVTGAVVMPNTIVRKGANLSYCIVGEHCVIEEGAKIGERPENYLDGDWGIAVVGHQRTIAAGSVIKPKEIV